MQHLQLWKCRAHTPVVVLGLGRLPLRAKPEGLFLVAGPFIKQPAVGLLEMALEDAKGNFRVAAILIGDFEAAERT